MAKPLLPLNALRAFEASARHLSFTRAAAELNVTQAAVSHQVKTLEERLGVKLFHRMPRALRLSDEGRMLLPELRDAFDRIAAALDRIRPGGGRQVVRVSLVATFALAWLVPRLPRLHAAHPTIELRLTTHNNRPVDLAADGVDVAIRFGAPGWPGVRSDKLFDYHVTPLCGRAFWDRLCEPADLLRVQLLRTADVENWDLWMAAAGLEPIASGGATFDSTRVAIEAAIEGVGVAIGSPYLFSGEIADGRLFQPFPLTIPNGKSYWLMVPEAARESVAVRSFRQWLLEEAASAPKG